MSLRFRSLQDLGRGAWRIASVTPLVSSQETLAQRASAVGAAPPSKDLRASSKQRERAGPTPHDLLWDAVVARWPTAVREFEGAVPGRRYRLDVALPEARIALEVDGFRHHGKHLEDFRRDRLRQNALVICGWRVLRFAAGDIRKDLNACLETIQALLEAIDHEQSRD
ncbi:DUF559 domain-containing protein [Thauera sp.]|uniref:endonuclease domain-containing protein n=1 Tax=Thauera sp. TaxID=1905334 RepID=UPI00257D3C3A|nr:DUF559 domain-containing protein [Thauera sp.]